MSGHDQSYLFRNCLWDVVIVIDFWHESAKLAYLPSFYALAFHNGWEDRNIDVHFNIADDLSTSDKNLVNFGPVTP